MIKAFLILLPLMAVSVFIFIEHGLSTDSLLMGGAGVVSSIIAYLIPKSRSESPEEMHARACSRL